MICTKIGTETKNDVLVTVLPSSITFDEWLQFGRYYIYISAKFGTETKNALPGVVLLSDNTLKKIKNNGPLTLKINKSSRAIETCANCG